MNLNVTTFRELTNLLFLLEEEGRSDDLFGFVIRSILVFNFCYVHTLLIYYYSRFFLLAPDDKAFLKEGACAVSTSCLYYYVIMFR